MWDVTTVGNFFTWCGKFLLTHPVWDVTQGVEGQSPPPSESALLFLLTHPVWDVTYAPCKAFNLLSTFLLTHPVWDVTFFPLTDMLVKNFYSHIPCGM